MKLKYSLIIGLVSVVSFGQNKIEKGVDSEAKSIEEDFPNVKLTSDIKVKK